MTRKTILIAFAILAVAAGSFAALSPQKAAYVTGPVQYIMTAEEKAQWKTLQTDQEADDFIALFWAKRDPTPGTARNEFREQFDYRVAAADKSLGAAGYRGSMTDQGRIFILFGQPKYATHSGGSGNNAIPEFGKPEDSALAGGELEMAKWTYEGDVAQKYFDKTHVEIRFSDRAGNHLLVLEPGRENVAGATEKVIAAAITNPNAKVEKVTVPMGQTPPAAPAAPAGPMTAFKTASLETAVTDARAGKAADKGASVSYAEFLSPSGDYYVPIGLFVPVSAGLTADAADTFFGAIDDSTGKHVVVVEEPAKAFASKNNSLFDYSANLPAGTYTATFGLAKAGVPVLVASTPVTAAPVAKDFVGTSRLVLGDIVETMEAAPVKAPFAFGKLKVVPRSSFSNKEELGYFIEIHNPGIDPTTNLPKLQTKLDLVPTSGPAISAPLMDAQALPLSGALGPGEYAVLSGIPLGDMKTPLKPGDYTLRIKVVDTVTKKSYTIEQKLKLVS